MGTGEGNIAAFARTLRVRCRARTVDPNRPPDAERIKYIDCLRAQLDGAGRGSGDVGHEGPANTGTAGHPLPHEIVGAGAPFLAKSMEPDLLPHEIDGAMQGHGRAAP